MSVCYSGRCGDVIIHQHSTNFSQRPGRRYTAEETKGLSSITASEPGREESTGGLKINFINWTVEFVKGRGCFPHSGPQSATKKSKIKAVFWSCLSARCVFRGSAEDGRSRPTVSMSEGHQGNVRAFTGMLKYSCSCHGNPSTIRESHAEASFHDSAAECSGRPPQDSREQRRRPAH